MLGHYLYQFAVTRCNEPNFFGLKPWYHYIDVDRATCEPRLDFFKKGKLDLSDLSGIGLAIVDDLLRIAAFVAIGFVIYGGYLYITSQGSPDQTQRAQNTIQNALIGLVIAVMSVALVAYIGNRIG